VSEESAETVEIDGITYTKNPDLTTENIELTYYTFENSAATSYMISRFMEIYPNIKVDYTSKTDGDYETGLRQRVEEENMPDIFFDRSDFGDFLESQLLLDITEYWNSDPETKELAPTIDECGIGTFSTTHQYMVPFRFYPSVMFVNKNTLNALNLELPSKDWTWDEMVDLVQKSTKNSSESSDGKAYYGLIDDGYDLGDIYQLSFGEKDKGPYGYNGKTFDLKPSIPGLQALISFYQGDCVPKSGTEDQTDSLSSGRIAILKERLDTFQSCWNDSQNKAYQEMDMVPYVAPYDNSANSAEQHNTLCKMDFGGISASCEHPQEAYELLKFMSYGQDGWKTRIQMYGDTSVRYDEMRVKCYEMPAPLTTNEQIWDSYIDMFCSGMEEESVNDWKDFFSKCMRPIPEGTMWIVGVSDFKKNFTLFDLDSQKFYPAEEYAAEGTRLLNWYHAKRMLYYFGSDGYDVLTEEEKKEYQDIVKENAEG
jgi:multiple sugar transport system substrate-binding protein